MQKLGTTNIQAVMYFLLKTKGKLSEMKSKIFFFFLANTSFNPILASVFCEVTLESLSFWYEWNFCIYYSLLIQNEFTLPEMWLSITGGVLLKFKGKSETTCVKPPKG